MLNSIYSSFLIALYTVYEEWFKMTDIIELKAFADTSIWETYQETFTVKNGLTVSYALDKAIWINENIALGNFFFCNSWNISSNVILC